MINILIVEPYKLPYEKKIPNTLEAKQKEVDGYIECVDLLEDDSVSVICNEDAKLKDLPLNRDIGYDIISGTFIVVGFDATSGEFISLTKEQIEKYKKRFDNESILKTEEKIVSLILNKKNKENLEISN